MNAMLTTLSTNTEAVLSGYITITEAAERLSVDRSTVWRWVKRGKITGARKKGPMENSALLIPEESISSLESELLSYPIVDPVD